MFTDTSPHSATSESILKDLELLEKAVHYRSWLYSLIAPFLGNRILEVGAGIGNYTDKFASAEFVLTTDYEEHYVTHLKERFRQQSHIEPMLLDIAKLDLETREAISRKRINTVVALNVIEHVEDDTACLRNLSEILQPNGVIVIVGPAFPFLFNCLDRAYGHFRRHVRSDFLRFQEMTSTELIHFRYFNLIGMAGWWLNGGVRKKYSLPPRQTMLFDKLVPALRAIESVVSPPLGLSLLAVLRKRSQPF